MRQWCIVSVHQFQSCKGRFTRGWLVSPNVDMLRIPAHQADDDVCGQQQQGVTCAFVTDVISSITENSRCVVHKRGHQASVLFCADMSRHRTLFCLSLQPCPSLNRCLLSLYRHDTICSAALAEPAPLHNASAAYEWCFVTQLVVVAHHVQFSRLA